MGKRGTSDSPDKARAVHALLLARAGHVLQRITKCHHALSGTARDETAKSSSPSAATATTSAASSCKVALGAGTCSLVAVVRGGAAWDAVEMCAVQGAADAGDVSVAAGDNLMFTNAASGDLTGTASDEPKHTGNSVSLCILAVGDTPVAQACGAQDDLASLKWQEWCL